MKRDEMKNYTIDQIAKTFAGHSYEDCTTQDKKRVTIAAEWIDIDYRGDGIYGAITELFCCPERSNKIKIATQGKNDSNVRFANYKGDVRSIPVEVKTGGGRIENMTGKYIIYTYCYKQKRKADKTHDTEWYIEKEVDPIIVPLKMFVDFLYKHKAVKCTNGKQPEMAIQPSNKALYEACKAWAVKYDRTKVYKESDFYGLEF